MIIANRILQVCATERRLNTLNFTEKRFSGWNTCLLSQWSEFNYHQKLQSFQSWTELRCICLWLWLSLSSSYCPDMTELLSKRVQNGKSFIHFSGSLRDFNHYNTLRFGQIQNWVQFRYESQLEWRLKRTNCPLSKTQLNIQCSNWPFVLRAG